MPPCVSLARVLQNGNCLATNGLQYNFIDTPGLNDTAGFDQDTINIRKACIGSSPFSQSRTPYPLTRGLQISDIAFQIGSLSALLIVINGTKVAPIDVLPLPNSHADRNNNNNNNPRPD